MAFLGMRGTGDWPTNVRPENFRQAILRLYPNGRAPLTAITSMMKSEKTDDPIVHWWEKELPTQAAAVTGVYTDTSLATAYTSGGVAGDTVHLKMTEANAKQFRIGHQCVMRDSDDYSVDVSGEVTARFLNGSSSRISVKLLEDDDNSVASHDLSDADRVLITGSISSEGSAMPEAVSYDVTEYDNYCQIFRTALSVTGTQLETKLRTGDAYAELKREALELHSMELERAFIWGVKSSGTGINGKPKRTMDGILSFIKTNASDNCVDYTLETAAAYLHKTWVEAGEDWFDEHLEQIFRYGSQEKLALVGSGALLGINRLAKAGGQMQINPKTVSYGLSVYEWVTPFGSLYVKTHPLFSYETTNLYSMLILEPANIRVRPLRDTRFKSDKSYDAAQWTNIDGKEEEWLTELTLELHFAKTFAYFNGVGQDNP